MNAISGSTGSTRTWGSGKDPMNSIGWECNGFAGPASERTTGAGFRLVDPAPD
jgi:hypothetical protein